MIKSAFASIQTHIFSYLGFNNNVGTSQQLVLFDEEVLSDTQSQDGYESAADETLSLPDYCIDRQETDPSPLPLALLPCNNHGRSTNTLHPQVNFYPPFSPMSGGHFHKATDFLPPPLRHSYSEDGISSLSQFEKKKKHHRLQTAFSSQLLLAGPDPPTSLLLLQPATHSPFKLGFGMASSQGVPRYNEDASFAGINDHGRLWFGVFDGHGGYEVSNYLAANISNQISSEGLNTKDLKSNDIGVRLQSLVEQMEHVLEQQYNEDWEGRGKDPGSTLMVGSVAEDGILTIANCGDCRCLIISQAFDNLGNRTAFVSRRTHDHSIGNLAEEARMKSLLASKWSASGNPEILWSEKEYLNSRINGNLEVSRSMGDFGCKRSLPGVVIAEAELYNWELDPKADLLAVAFSDGVSSAMDETEICHQICRSLNDPKHLNNLEKAAAELNAYAIAQGSEDNVTTILISFHSDLLPPAPHRRRLFGRQS